MYNSFSRHIVSACRSIIRHKPGSSSYSVTNDLRFQSRNINNDMSQLGMAEWILPKISTKHDALGFTLVSPGFMYASQDRSGHVTLWDLAKWAEHGRVWGYRNIPWMHRLFKERLLFAVSFSYNIRPNFYAVDQHMYSPLIYEDSIINVGKSSYQHRFKATSAKSQNVLFDGSVNIVFVDINTRKPIPLPDWFDKTYRDLQASHSPDVRMSRLTVPEEPHIVPYIPLPSDTDYYGHVNQAAYLRICYDALTKLARSGKLPNMQEDPVFTPTNSVSGVYLEETNEGEAVDISVWQDTKDVMTYHFHIHSKQTNSATFQCTLNFDNHKLTSKF